MKASMAGAQRAKEEWGRMGWRVDRSLVGKPKDTVRAQEAFEVFSTEQCIPICFSESSFWLLFGDRIGGTVVTAV